MLTSGTAGIAADNYSHVKYFPNGQAYDDYYDIVVDIGEVGVPEFADRVQELPVDISAKHIVTPPPIGVASFGRAIVAGCASRMLVMPEATTTWASKSPGA